MDPVVFSSTTNALGLNLGYYIGPQTATYTIDGVTGTVTVPSHPNTLFLGFIDTKPVTVSFTTDEAEFDVTRVVTGTALAAVPEPATWALMICGIGMTGGLLRRRKATLAIA